MTSAMRVVNVSVDGFATLRGERGDEPGVMDTLVFDLREVVAIALWGRVLDADAEPLRMVKLALRTGDTIEVAGRNPDLVSLRDAWFATRSA